MNPPGAPPAFLGGPGNPNGNPNGAFGLPMAMGQAPAQMPPQQQMQAGAAGQPLDEFRQGFLELLEEQALTDIEMTVGPQNEEIGAHRAILAAQSNHFRLLIARDPESLPLLCPLPQLHPQAVKLLLRFFYSGLVGVVDCGGDPMLVVECLRATDAFLQGAPQDRPKLDALKLHLESQLTSSLDSEAAGKAIAMLNTTGLKDTLDRCMPLFMAHARRNGGSVLQGLLEGVDLDTFVAAVKGSEFPGGEIQKFRFIRAWAEGNHAGEKERVVLDSLIDLEGIGLDDMEREVEPSGIVPVQRLMRQYTLMARRLRAQSAMNRSGSSATTMSVPGASSGALGQQSSQTSLTGMGPGGGAPPPRVPPAMSPPSQSQQLPPQAPQLVPPVFPPPGGHSPQPLPGQQHPLPPGKGALNAPSPMPQLPPLGQLPPPSSLPPPQGMPPPPGMPPPQGMPPPTSIGGFQGGMPGGMASPRQQMQMPPGMGSGALGPGQFSAPPQNAGQMAPAPAPLGPSASPPAAAVARSASAVPSAPSNAGVEANMGPLPLPGFSGWETTPELQPLADSLTFPLDTVRSIRMPVPLTSGTWRWVVLMEKTFGAQGGVFGKKKNESYFPDVGILIGGDFDPNVGLRQQKNCCAWDGRDMVSVNGMPVPYSRAKGGPFKDGDVIMVDVDLDHKTLAFRKNGVECGTAIRGFPPMVHLVLAGRSPARVRWLALQQLA